MSTKIQHFHVTSQNPPKSPQRCSWKWLQKEWLAAQMPVRKRIQRRPAVEYCSSCNSRSTEMPSMLAMMLETALRWCCQPDLRNSSTKRSVPGLTRCIGDELIFTPNQTPRLVFQFCLVPKFQTSSDFFGPVKLNVFSWTLSLPFWISGSLGFFNPKGMPAKSCATSRPSKAFRAVGDFTLTDVWLCFSPNKCLWILGKTNEQHKFYPSCKFETWMKSFQPHNSWAWWHPMKQQQKWGQAKAERCQRSGLKRRKMKGQSAQRPAPGRWHLAKMCKATQKHQKLSKICRYLSIMSSFCYLFDLILTC